MDGLRKLVIEGVEILYLDYSGKNEKEMIDLLWQAIRLVKEEKKEQVRLLSNFKGTYITGGYLAVLRKEVREVLPLINRSAIIGLNEPKRWILKGFNMFFKVDFRPFETEAEAISWLSTD